MVSTRQPRVAVADFERLLEQIPRDDRLDFFESLPDELQDDFWQSLAGECVLHWEAQRLVDPEQIAWHRKPRVGRLWDVPRYPSRPTLRAATAMVERQRDVLREIEPRVYVELLTGEHVPPHGTIRCPMPGHEDRTASFRVYDTPQAGWYCFGHQSGGDVYDFAAELWTMDTRREFPELRRRIAEVLCGKAAA